MATEEEFLEIHRLAMLGGEAEIARHVAGRLASTWLGLSRFRDVKDLCLETLEAGRDPDILNSLARARGVLGEVEEAMRVYLEAQKMYEEVGDRSGMATTRMRIGTLVVGNTYRNPAVLANIVGSIQGKHPLLSTASCLLPPSGSGSIIDSTNQVWGQLANTGLATEPQRG
jgi:alkanesulfonate monooxygenase SsuD/methylene tetrahydromethanopterin reductase-like flavin-dependent oxidoreductase (luciferase family)